MMSRLLGLTLVAALTACGSGKATTTTTTTTTTTQPCTPKQGDSVGTGGSPCRSAKTVTTTTTVTSSKDSVGSDARP